jgi:hypothetical protein
VPGVPKVLAGNAVVPTVGPGKLCDPSSQQRKIHSGFAL